MNRNLLDKLKKLALSDVQLSKLSGHRVLLYNELYDYLTLEELLDKNNKAVIILYLHDNDNFGHYCCITRIPNIKGKEAVEFWDSYGCKPDAVVNTATEEINEKYEQGDKYLSKIMKESPYVLTFNEHKFQKPDPTVNTCGPWCCTRLMNKSLSLDQFYNMIKNIKEEHKLLKDYDDVCVAYLADKLMPLLENAKDKGDYIAGKTEVHSVLFNRELFNTREATKWLKKHNFKPIKRVHKTEKYLRYRIREPEYSKYRTQEIDNGILFVYGID